MSVEKQSINASVLAEAQKYYSEHGYIDTPTPWLVGEDAYWATLPPEHEAFLWQSPLGQYHVGSAEQGFIQMMLDGETLPERAQSTTPCFRGEPTYDSLHFPFFYKLELYAGDTSTKTLEEMIACARGLFRTLKIPTRVVETGEHSYDIETALSHIELGSYGIRTFRGHEWTYGTGIALPRAAQARSVERSMHLSEEDRTWWREDVWTAPEHAIGN